MSPRFGQSQEPRFVLAPPVWVPRIWQERTRWIAHEYTDLIILFYLRLQFHYLSRHFLLNLVERKVEVCPASKQTYVLDSTRGIYISADSGPAGAVQPLDFSSPRITFVPPPDVVPRKQAYHTQMQYISHQWWELEKLNPTIVSPSI